MQRLLLLLLCWVPVVAFAQKVGEPLVGTREVVNDGPGNQSDPHVSEALVAYTNESQGTSEIRFHNLSTGVDQAIANGGAYDFAADVSGDTVVFTRLSTTSSIFIYNVGTQAPAVEVAPQPGSNRRSAVIGSRTLAWQDYSYATASEQPEISVFNLDTQALTRLTTDDSLDRSPAVSSDGSTVVWSKCASGTECDIWQAAATPSGFDVKALTGAQGEESQPDTNGEWVVYSSARTENGVTDRDIYWQAVGGGPEYRLALPGVDGNPSISGSLIAFERQDPTAATFNYDLMLFDLKTETLYRLTNTPESEKLNDISVGMDGLVRVVWSVPDVDDNVESFTFRLPGNPQCQPQLQDVPTPEAVCDAPGNRPLLASVTLERTPGLPQEESRSFQAQGNGVLCVDNAYMGAPATAGWVELNGATVMGPDQLQKDVKLVAQAVALSGENTLAARIIGSPGSCTRVRVYGPPPACAARFTGDETIPGKHVAPQPWLPPVEPSGLAGTGGSGLACGVGGDSLAWCGGFLLAVWLWHARREPVPVRRRSGPRER